MIYPLKNGVIHIKKQAHPHLFGKIIDLKERKNGSKFAKLIEDCLLIDESEVLDAGLSII